ncbi:MAG: RNA polymerase sigma factor [Syntrophorhabdales bacterium]|jgi:RNA polymerase sigma factor (sigma-70 family)
MIEDVQSVIQGCLSADGAAWNSFFSEYAPMAMNLLGRMADALSIEEKEDIVQNTFSKLLKGGLKNFRGTTRYEFFAYFKKIVINEARTYLKSEKEWKNKLSFDEEGDRDLDGAQLATDRDQEVYGGAKRDEQLQIIKTVLEGSPLEARQVLIMKMEGYKDREIADILGISLGTVASRYARIRERIKEYSVK